jgi:hypothetical protein
MTKSEHITAFRKKHAAEQERLQLYLKIGTKKKLNALARRYGYNSITALLESLDKVLKD